MKVYYELFHTLSTAKQKYHGGGNYSKKTLDLLLEKKDVEVVLIGPFDSFQNGLDSSILSNPRVSLITVDKFSDVIEFDKNSILFCPVLFEFKDFRTLNRIKCKNPSLKIYATIHDLRNLDYYFDYAERYYFCGLKKIIFPFYQVIAEGIIPKLNKRLVSKTLGVLDKIFTDSNHSAQHILRLNPNACVTTYYIPTITDINTTIHKNNDSYILFVSGGRRLKNLVHALGGFSIYKKNNPTSRLYMYITGITNEQFEALMKYPGVDKTIIKSWIKIYDYVTLDELSSLYLNCKFLLYTSKREGFGLPLLEAAMYGKTAVASNVTSIPEVLGTAAFYVNPWSDKSIARGLAFFDNESNLNKYEKRVMELTPVLKRRTELDMGAFFDDFLNG